MTFDGYLSAASSQRGLKFSDGIIYDFRRDKGQGFFGLGGADLPQGDGGRRAEKRSAEKEPPDGRFLFSSEF